MNNTEQHRHTTECREWLARIRAKRPRNVLEGQRLMNIVLMDIAKKRGQDAADKLRAGIEAERTKRVV